MERKVKLPDTSLDAHKRVHGDMLREHYNRIVEALKKLGTANYERIAMEGKFTDRNQVSRRLKEMVGLNMVVRTDLKSATSSGRSAYNYTLSQKSVPDMVNDIIHQCTKPESIQPELF